MNLKEYLAALNSSQKITRVDLGWGNIGDEGAKLLAEALKVNTTVTSVDLNNNKIGLDGVKALAEALKVNKTVQSVHLWDNRMIGADGVKVLAEALKVNKTVTDLVLGTNNIGSGGAKTLADLLVNTNLIKLVVRANNIGDEGAKAIAEALKVNTTVRTVLLGSNNIGDEGAKAIAEALKANKNITYLDLWDNKIGAELKKRIESLVSENQKQAVLSNQKSITSDFTTLSKNMIDIVSKPEEKQKILQAQKILEQKTEQIVKKRIDEIDNKVPQKPENFLKADLSADITKAVVAEVQNLKEQNQFLMDLIMQLNDKVAILEGNKQIVNCVTDIMCDNELLNYPDLLKLAAQEFGFAQALDISFGLSYDLVLEAIEHSSAELVLAGCISLNQADAA